MNRRLSLCAAVLTSVLVAIQSVKTDSPACDPWAKEAGDYCRTGTIEGNSKQIQLTWGVRSLPWLILTDNRHVVTAEGFPVNELDDRLKGLESPK